MNEKAYLKKMMACKENELSTWFLFKLNGKSMGFLLLLLALLVTVSCFGEPNGFTYAFMGFLAGLLYQNFKTIRVTQQLWLIIKKTTDWDAIAELLGDSQKINGSSE